MIDVLRWLFEVIFRGPGVLRIRRAFNDAARADPSVRVLGYARPSITASDFLVILVYRWPNVARIVRLTAANVPETEIELNLDEADALWNELLALNIKNLTFSFPLHRDAWRFVIGYLIDGRSRIMAYDGLNLGSPQEAICKRLEQFFADKGVAVD